jgi:hypothetical protein
MDEPTIACSLGAEDYRKRLSSIRALGDVALVIVLRDVQGAMPSVVRRSLDLRPEEERALLQQARGLVRSQLEHYFEEREGDDEG